MPSRICQGVSRLHQSIVGFFSGDDRGGMHGAIGVRPMHRHGFAEPSAVQAVHPGRPQPIVKPRDTRSVPSPGFVRSLGGLLVSLFLRLLAGLLGA